MCPTGALFRTEFGTVVVLGDICNGCGCGYCVASWPYGVIDQRKDDGWVFTCTMCYDRLTDGLQPACATACPTQYIQFGDLDEAVERQSRQRRPESRSPKTTSSVIGVKTPPPVRRRSS
ncbi:4Fe-4S dicluster domain-containing protein [Blastococcus mobilis]|uniref:4Fe-4S dicluster domain-containing protein n=1 Tax=Blastococcus mobilis TaxID=1938746 RepID=A0A238WGH5_9ACTN|nr:4Fe-4S dicluster domain-containing protein [Blastococcus mobilis]